MNCSAGMGLRLALGLLTAATVQAGEAFELRGDAALGFDTNPAQSRAGSALAFARYAFDGRDTWSRGADRLGLAADGWYRDYEAANDAWHLSLGADWSRATAAGLGRWRVELTGALHRDALVPADARNEAAVGVGYERLVSARDTLSLTAESRWLDYLNAAPLWAGRPGSGTRSGMTGMGHAYRMGQGRGGSTAVAPGRDDRCLTLELALDRVWSPAVTTQFSLAYADNASSVRGEGYGRPKLGARLRLDVTDAWSLEAGLDGSLARYQAASPYPRREDRQLGVELTARRSPGGNGRRGAFQCSLAWIDNDSTLAAEVFHQWVIECGWSRSLR